MAMTILGTTNDGIKVFLHPETHTDHGVDMTAVTEAIGSITMGEATIGRALHYDCGRVVGLNALVEDHAGDTIVLFARGSRKGLSRMNMSREAEPSRFINVVCGIVPGGDGNCYLYTAYAGEDGPREPFDRSLTTPELKAESEAFWSCHSLVPNAEQREAIEAAQKRGEL